MDENVSFLMRKYRTYLRLGRPRDGLKYALLFLIGAITLSSKPITAAHGIISFTIILMSMAITAHNDIKDIEIDKISNKERPLASNKLSMKEAQIFWKLLAIFSLAVAAAFGYILALFFAIFLTLGLIYNNWLSRSWIASPIIMALAVVNALSMGLAYGNGTLNDKSIIIMTAAFMLSLAIIPYKDFKDKHSDQKAKKKTIANQFNSTFVKIILFLASTIILALLNITVQRIGTAITSLILLGVQAYTIRKEETAKLIPLCANLILISLIV